MKKSLPKIIAFIVSFLLVFEQSVFAQTGMVNLPAQPAAVNSAPYQEFFRPCHLRGLAYDRLTDDCRLFLDKGSLSVSENSEMEGTGKQLLTYFLIGLSLPNQALWVNLRPDGEDNVIDEQLARTDLGKVLLENDLQLKRDTARYTSPDTPTGKLYWDKLYKKAEELFGSQEVSIPTLTRPWIVPGEIIVRESPDSVYIYKASLKVMLEQDYLKGSREYSFADGRMKELNDYSTALIRRIILPQLTREINSARRYASLRQAYYSLIMAQWFKARFAGNAGKYSRIMNSRVLSGLTSAIPWSKGTYFHAYEKSFKQGEYNTQAVAYTASGQRMRSYFSGGVAINIGPLAQAGMAMRTVDTGSTFFSISAPGALPGDLRDGGARTVRRTRLNWSKLRWDRLLSVVVIVAGVTYGVNALVIPKLGELTQSPALSAAMIVQDYSRALNVAKTAQSKEERVAAIQSLAPGAASGDKEVLEFLLATAKTAVTNDERVTAIYSLGPAAGAGNAQVFGFLRGMAETSASQEDRLAALNSLGQAAGEKTNDIVDFLKGFSANAKSPAERIVAIGYLGRAAGEGNEEAFSTLISFAGNDKTSLETRMKALEALPATSRMRDQTRDGLAAFVKNTGYSSRLRAASFYQLAAKTLIDEKQTQELVPYLAQINQDKDNTVQRTVANSIVALAGSQSYDPTPIPWSTGDAAAISAREAIEIKDNTKLAGNRSGPIDLKTAELIIDSSVRLDVDPYVSLGVMLKENPIYADGRSLDYTRRYGEIPPNSLPAEELIEHHRELVTRALGSPDGDQDVVIAINFHPEGNYYGTDPADVAVLSSANLNARGLDVIYNNNMCLFHISNYDPDGLSVKGNLGVAYEYLKIMSGDGSSPAKKIQHNQGDGMLETSRGKVDTRINPIYGNAVIAYINGPLNNPKINEIVAEKSQKYGKPAPSIFSGGAARDGGDAAEQEAQDTAYGGIDFTSLPIAAQSMNNLTASIRADPLPVARLISRDLTREWKKIAQLVNAGMTPQADRIKEYMQLSCYKGTMSCDEEKVSDCIADILRIEEERGLPTDPVLRDMLVVLDSADTQQSIMAVFMGDKVIP